MHKTTSEGEALLECILDNTSFVEPLVVKELPSHEEAPVVESAPLLLTYLDSPSEPLPELESPEEQEIQPPEFPFKRTTFFKIFETPRCIPVRRGHQFPKIQ